jgi:aminoglycoside phosphotransferase (APT) family kinase protein
MTGANALPPEADLMSVEDSAVSFDWARVAEALAAAGLEFDRAFAPRRFAGGLANINMLVRVDGEFAVLRRPPDGPIPKGAHDMAREHRVLSGLAPVLPLAPRSLFFCGDPDVAGAPFQVLEYRGGRLVRGDKLAPLPDTPETAAALSRMLIETLAQVHEVDLESTGLNDLGRPEGFLARTAKGWISRADAVLDGNLPAAAREVVEWLAANPGVEAKRPALLHNDFKLDNLLLAPDRIAPIALLDWDMATRGDALHDLASLLSYWVEPSDPPCMHQLAQMPTARPGFLSRAEAAEAYSALTGRSLNGFQVQRVVATFRLAVVFHQLRKLAAGNPRMEARLTGLDPDDLFGFALDVAHGKAF